MMIWVWFLETEMAKFTHTWDIFYLYLAHTCSDYTVIFVLGKTFDKKKKKKKTDRRKYKLISYFSRYRSRLKSNLKCVKHISFLVIFLHIIFSYNWFPRVPAIHCSHVNFLFITLKKKEKKRKTARTPVCFLYVISENICYSGQENKLLSKWMGWKYSLLIFFAISEGLTDQLSYKEHFCFIYYYKRTLNSNRRARYKPAKTSYMRPNGLNRIVYCWWSQIQFL